MKKKLIGASLMFAFCLSLNRTDAQTDNAAQKIISHEVSMTQAQATQVAIDFSHRIGQPITASVRKAKFIPQEVSPGLNWVRFWHPHWELYFGTEAEVQIDTTSGVVMNYFSLSGSAKGAALGSASPQTGISRQEAVSRAEEMLRATGVSFSELQFKSADEQGNGPDNVAVDHEWFVSWQRVWNGIPYFRQDANVTVYAETGDLDGFSINFRSLPPDHSIVNGSKENAAIVARQQMQAAGWGDWALEDVTEKVVQANTMWQSGDTIPHAEQSYTVWDCKFTAPSNGVSVWIDTETGNVIGGWGYASLGTVKTKPMLLRRQLKNSPWTKAAWKKKAM